MNHPAIENLTIDSKRFNWSEKEIKIIHDRIGYFKSFRKKPINEENFSELCNTLYYLIDLIPLPTISIDLPFIIRSRPNEGAVLFSEEWEISYNSRATDIIGAGRFNRPKESMFYGCGFGENADKNDFIITACLESCKKILDPGNTSPFQYFTVGQWKVNQHFEVINLCYNEGLLSINPKIKKRVDLFIQDLEVKFGVSGSRVICEFWRFLTDLAAKKEEVSADHFLTSAVFTVIGTYYQREMNRTINGIFYPSPITRNEGINLVLTPDAVNRLLTLEKVCMVKFERWKSDPKHYNIFQCSKVADVAGNKFILEIDDDFKPVNNLTASPEIIY
jgi:hypothetical protein